MLRILCFVIFSILLINPAGLALAQTGEFQQPWKDKTTAIIIDPYACNSINWDQLATDKRVVAIIHKATEFMRVDKQYSQRKVEAKKRGYLWGSYHLARSGDPIKQADFYLETVAPDKDEVVALDIETLNDISINNARLFIKRIQEKIGRYPIVYGNNSVIKAISDKVGKDDIFSKTPLWYARFRNVVTDFPKKTWDTYTLWQFSSEINCKPSSPNSCPYLVPGTKTDIDVNVYYGSIEQLRKNWPFSK